MDVEELRLTYDLNPNSIVMDIGSFIGQFSRKIYDRYKCRVFGFEPIKEFYDKANNELLKGKPVKVFNCAVGIEEKQTIISFKGDQSSIIDNGGENRTIQITTPEKALAMMGVTHVDLVKINIEGMEYELIDYLFNNNLLTRFKDIQVQFHRIPNGWEHLATKANEQLSKTHHKTYDYPFIWTNWRRS